MNSTELNVYINEKVEEILRETSIQELMLAQNTLQKAYRSDHTNLKKLEVREESIAKAYLA